MSEINTRILRDMTDGVIAISSENGRITFANQTAEDLLSAGGLNGQSFATAFIGDERNDSFAELILKSVYDKEQPHNGDISYYGADGTKRLNLTVSFVFTDNGDKQGVVVIIKDITELARLATEKKEGVFLFTMGMCAVSVYLIIWQILSAFMPVPDWLMARVMEVLAFAMFVCAMKFTSMNLADVGLAVKKQRLLPTLLRGGLIGAGIVVLFALARLVLNQVSPETALLPFFDAHFHDDPTQAPYFIVAPFQEFLAKGVVLTSLMRIYGQGSKHIPILVSSLIFAAMHVNYGIAMMTGAFGLCFATGYLYNRDRNIWGCAIIHFCVGFFSTAFNLL